MIIWSIVDHDRWRLILAYCSVVSRLSGHVWKPVQTCSIYSLRGCLVVLWKMWELSPCQISLESLRVIVVTITFSVIFWVRETFQKPRRFFFFLLMIIKHKLMKILMWSRPSGLFRPKSHVSLCVLIISKYNTEISTDCIGIACY